MRYPEAHAATSGSVPFALRGRKAVRTVLAAAAAVGVGVIPSLTFTVPAAAASSVLTVSSPTAVSEGTAISFTLTYTGAGATYSLTTTPGTTNPATAGSDYTNPAGPSATVTFGDGTGTAKTATVLVQTTDDGLYENPETFNLVATNNASSSDFTSGLGTINDNDSMPSFTLSAAPNPVTESAGATTAVTAKLSTPSGVPTSITLTTSDGSALVGSDFAALANPTTITIPAGQLTATQPVTIAITDDGKKDTADTETFVVNGSGTVVSPATASTTVSITDAQKTPKLTLSGGGSGSEGGATTFTVTTDTASELPISVQWNAVDVTPAAGHSAATADDDFTYPPSRTVTIPAGSTTKDFTVSLLTDTLTEDPEDYAIQLVNPTNAVLGATTKVGGTITDTTAAPTLTVLPSTVTEGDNGKTTKTFTATLSAKSAKTVRAAWATADKAVALGNARAGKDYAAAAGTLTFTPGTTAATFSVDILGDTIDEGALGRTVGGSANGDGEKFDINLTALPGETPATLGTTAAAEVTILDDDAAPTLTFDNLAIKEGSTASAALVPIKLTGSSDRPISVTPATVMPGAAPAAQTYSTTFGDDDFAPLTQTSITIQPETSTGYFPVLINGDSIYEPDETIGLTVTPGTTTAGSSWLNGAPTAADPAVLTLQNDDTAPDLEVKSVKGKEGETVQVWGTVTGTSQSPIYATVSFLGTSVRGSKAASAGDFTNPGAKAITIAPGTVPGSTKFIADVPLLADDQVEPEETILATGSTTGNIGSVTDGVIYIAADGSTPGGPGTEEPGQAPKPTIKAPAKVVGPSKVAIEGVVAPMTEVQLWSGLVAGNAPLKWVKNITSDKDGYYYFEQDISWGTNFMTMSQMVKSDYATVWVQQDPLFVASTSTRGQITFGIKGDPMAAGQSAAVQQWVGGTWTNIRAGKTGADGVYRVTVKWPSGSKPTVRGLVAGEAAKGTQTGASAQQTPTVK